MTIVYVLANPSFPDFIKIGRCKNIDQRLSSLSSNTALPLPFQCVFACTVDDPKAVEKTLHRTFREYRVNPKREFFRMSPEPVIELLQLLSKGEIEPSSEKLASPSSDEKFLEDLYSEFTFDQAAVPLGSEIVFARMDSLACFVTGRNEVEFEGSQQTLTDATRTALGRVGKDPKIKLSPARYWLYEGEVLAHRKHQKIHGRLD